MMDCRMQFAYEKELKNLSAEVDVWKTTALGYKAQLDRIRKDDDHRAINQIDIYRQNVEKDKYIRALENEIQEVRIWLAERDLAGPHRDFDETEFFEKA